MYEVVSRCLPDGKWTREKLVSETTPYLADKLNLIPFDYPGVFKVLLNAKADISARGPEGKTPLFIAACENNVQALNALLAAGADMNDAFVSGVTPLMVASEVGSLGAVNTLITAGADLNCADDRGFTAIMIAILFEKNAAVVSALIAAGADVNYVCKRMNLTVLDMAMANESSDICAVLEEAGAKTIKELMIETSDLVRAGSSGDMEQVQQLVKGAGKDEKNAALVIAVNDDKPPMVKCLLASGADPDAKYGFLNVLMVACIHGNADIVRALLDAGADITAKDEDGKTALQHAAKHKHRDIVALLLAKAKELKNANK
jgi:ankyrin repeat protein